MDPIEERLTRLEQLVRRHTHDGIETEDLGIATTVTNSGASVFVGAQQAIPGTTVTQIHYDTEVYDLNSEFDTSAYSFQPTQAGYYLAYAQIQWETEASGTGQTRYIRIYKNGSLYQNREGTQAIRGIASPVQSLASIIFLNGGSDYLTFYCYQDTGGPLNIQNDKSFVDIHLLSTT